MKTTSCFDVYELVFLQLSHCLQLVLTTNCMQKQQIPLMCICSNEFYYLIFKVKYTNAPLNMKVTDKWKWFMWVKYQLGGGGVNIVKD